MLPTKTVDGVTAALVLGSMFPDVDIGLIGGGFDVYLRAHAAGTHSILGTLIGACVVAGTLRLILRASRMLPLLVASWLGTVGHVICDVANGSDIRVMEPLSHATVGWHLVAMADPILLAILVIGAVAAHYRPSLRRTIAAAALTAVAMTLVAKAGSQALARGMFERLRADRSVAAIVPPRGSMFRWRFVERLGDGVQSWTVNARTGTIAQEFAFRDASTTSAVTLSSGLPVVRTFMTVARVPFVRVEHNGGLEQVLWSDASACSAEGCDVSFGAEFDAAGRVVWQLIRVGGFTERRSPAASGR